MIDLIQTLLLLYGLFMLGFLLLIMVSGGILFYAYLIKCVYEAVRGKAR